MSSFLPNRTVSVYDFEINDCYYDVDGAEAVGNVDHFSSFEPKQENREKMEEFSPIKSRTFDNSVASVEDRWPDGMREILSDSHFKALHSSMYNHMAIMNQRLFRPEWLASLWYPTNARKQNQSPDECFGFAKSERVDLFEAWLKFKNFQKRIAEVPRANEALVSAMLQHFLAEAMGYGPPDSSSGKCFIHHELSVRQEKRNFRKQRLRQEPMSESSSEKVSEKASLRVDFAVSTTALFPDSKALPTAFRNDNEKRMFRLIFEVKKPSEKLDNHMNQVSSYLEELKTPWVVLTNGTQWKLISRHANGDHYLVDISKIDNVMDFRYFYYFFRAKAFGVGLDSSTPSWNDYYFKRRLVILTSLRNKLPDVAKGILNTLAKICGINSIQPHSAISVNNDRNGD